MHVRLITRNVLFAAMRFLRRLSKSSYIFDSEREKATLCHSTVLGGNGNIKSPFAFWVCFVRLSSTLLKMH